MPHEEDEETAPGDLELGIPGHAGKSPASRRLQRYLKEKGVSFESEGDAVRININGLIIEVNDEGDRGIIVQAQAPLPVGEGIPEEEARTLYYFGLAASIIGGGEYLAEEIVPGYPTISVSKPVEGLEEAAEKIIAVVEALLAVTGKTRHPEQ